MQKGKYNLMQVFKRNRTKFKRSACQQEESQHYNFTILRLHHLKRGWGAGIHISQWTEPYLKTK